MSLGKPKEAFEFLVAGSLLFPGYVDCKKKKIQESGATSSTAQDIERPFNVSCCLEFHDEPYL